MIASNLVVYAGTSPELEQLCGLASRHPELGAFFDCGTYSTVIDCPAGASGVQRLAGRLSDACGAAEPGLFREVPALSAISPDAAKGGPSVWYVDATEEADTASTDLDPLHRLLGQGVAVSLLLRDGRQEMAPMWLLASLALPCLGQIPPCSGSDVLATWMAILGRTPGAGQDLLALAAGHDPARDRDLSARLRQLYGSDN
jgi:hypothetical protein